MEQVKGRGQCEGHFLDDASESVPHRHRPSIPILLLKWEKPGRTKLFCDGGMEVDSQRRNHHTIQGSEEASAVFLTPSPGRSPEGPPADAAAKEQETERSRRRRSSMSPRVHCPPLCGMPLCGGGVGLVAGSQRDAVPVIERQLRGHWRPACLRKRDV